MSAVAETPLLFPPPSRTTAGASGLVVQGDRLLMVRQERATGVRWEVPGGGQEAGESLEETVVRELAEEAAVPVLVSGLVCTYASFRPHRGSAVIGAFFTAVPTDDVAPVPQRDDGIVEAAFVDPTALPDGDIGPLSGAVLARWWPRRNEKVTPFHVELWRDENGYLLR
jgi:ADP-ribose pyrophosphatase YjhB (NUDIX family)